MDVLVTEKKIDAGEADRRRRHGMRSRNLGQIINRTAN